MIKSCCKPCIRIFSFSNTIRFYLLILVFLVSGNYPVFSQTRNFFTADTVYNSKRVKAVAIGTGSLYVASMAGLYQLWYADTNLTSLHSFDDNKEWLQMDKIGHIGSAYYVGKMGISVLNWTGLSRKKAIWYGGLMGAFFQTSIEFFDGISPSWGFSWGDIAANAIGSSLLISQQLAWNEQRIQFKLSFHQTKYARLRPDLLGNSFVENLFKDYNGQTYWLSANIASFLPQQNRFPKWLGIAVGYGAEGMTGAFENPSNFENHVMPSFERYRQIYISPDIDLTAIKTRSKFLNTVLYSIGFIKFPLPGIEIGVPGKIRILPLVF